MILACLATIVVPLGLWFVLGLVPALRPAQAWLTTFPSVQHLLSGEMSPVRWAQWCCPADLGNRAEHRRGCCACAARLSVT
ncbi:MAG TPA: hypothetical protein VLJ88_02345 [Propionibacteriaceae bacterium]|nr:hypothetical protein [Propionibacteriaceae bacterium]